MSDQTAVRIRVVASYAHNMMAELLQDVAATPGAVMPGSVSAIHERLRDLLGDAFEECYLQFHFPEWSRAAEGGPAMREDALRMLDHLLAQWAENRAILAQG